MKPLIPIFDDQFAHSASFGTGDLGIGPTYFNWYRGREKLGDVCFVTESWFDRIDQIPYEHKIALIIEPPAINNKPYEWIRWDENNNKFDYILTHNKEIIRPKGAGQPMKYYPFGGCWILPEDRKLYNKTKDVSIIASWKNETEGHKLRHEIIKRFGNQIDVFGNGYQKVDNKIEALRDYKYTIVVENDKRFFTEKIIDAFVTGTIPIYYGYEHLDDLFYNVLFFNGIDDIEQILKNVKDPIADKNDILNSLSINFCNAEQFCIPEDWIWRYIILANDLLCEFNFHFQ